MQELRDKNIELSEILDKMTFDKNKIILPKESDLEYWLIDYVDRAEKWKDVFPNEDLPMRQKQRDSILEKIKNSQFT